MDRLIREDLEQLGSQLRYARRQLGLTQAEVGRRAGISRQLVNRIEAGHNSEIAAVVAIANILDRRVRLIGTVPPSEGKKAAMELIAQLRNNGKPEVDRE